MLYRITRHTALTSAHRPRLIESTHTTTILTRRDRNISSIRDVTEAITLQADESAQISQSLNQLANQQQALMDQFRV